MKLYIKIFKDNNFGNYHSDLLIIPNNKLRVSSFKQIIQEKYGVNHSNQRLTIKMGNTKFVTLTDDFPLNFYFIKENSIIYLEFMGKFTEMEEISKKMHQRAIKSKYLKTLGIFGNSPMETIKESPSEYVNEENKNKISNNNSFIQRRLSIYNLKNNYNKAKRQNSCENFYIISLKERPKLILEKFKKAIISNKLNEFREIMDCKYKFLDINAFLENNKYAPIHYAAIYGYAEMMEDLINKYNADVNLISVDKWSPLHLSSYKGHIMVVDTLLQCKETNFDLNLPNMGTALHCACKRNNFKIVSLLLLKCNPNIKNEDGLLPIDMTSDLGIKKIINKVMNKNNKKYEYIKKESDLKVNDDININNNKKRKMDFINFSFLKLLKQIPNLPAIYKGFVYKKEKESSDYNLRYIQIDPIKGFLLPFLSKEDFPLKPTDVLLLKSIIDLKKNDDEINNFFYIELLLENNLNHIYRFERKDARNNWFDALNLCINFIKFWNKHEKEYPEVPVYLNSLQQDIFEINYESGETKKVGQKIKRVKTKRKNQYPIFREDRIKIKEERFFNSYIGFKSFEILDCLGAGSFGKVFKVRMKTNGEIYAMKVINKNFLIRNHQLRYAITECNVLKQVKSPFILTLYYSFQTEKNLYMILDYCPGGDLNFHILKDTFEEDDAKFYVAELILGIEHLHSLNIMYRDLKPENILISSDNHIKLADFGLAKEGVNDMTLTKSFCGSPAYLSPEMLVRKGAGKSADIYGIGAVLYEMICGTPPFFSNNIKTLYKNITQSKLVFPEYFSDELRNLLKQLLCRDPLKRIGVIDKSELKRHIWFEGINWEKLAKKEVKPPLDLIQIKRNLENNKTVSNIKDLKISFKDEDYKSSDKKINDLNRVPKFSFKKFNK